MGESWTTRRVLMPESDSVVLDSLWVDDGDLGPDEVVMALRYSLISPGTELGRLRGRQVQGVGRGGATAPAFPFAPGYAAAGVALAAGRHTGLAVGDRLFAHVGHQGIVRFDARRRLVRPIPAAVSDRAAPFTRLAQVGGVALRLMAARAGDRAVVVGLGLVGVLAAQLAALAGLEVVGVDPSASRRAVARSVGVSLVLSPEEAETQLPRSAAVVLECAGRAGAAALAVTVAAERGEVFLVGAPWEREEDVPATSVLGAVFQGYLSLRSGWEWQLPLSGDGPGSSLARISDWILSALGRGRVRTEELVTDVVSPEEVPAAYRALATDPDAHLGVLISWGEPEVPAA